MTKEKLFTGKPEYWDGIMTEKLFRKILESQHNQKLRAR